MWAVSSATSQKSCTAWSDAAHGKRWRVNKPSHGWPNCYEDRIGVCYPIAFASRAAQTQPVAFTEKKDLAALTSAVRESLDYVNSLKSSAALSVNGGAMGEGLVFETLAAELQAGRALNITSKYAWWGAKIPEGTGLEAGLEILNDWAKGFAIQPQD